MLWVVRQFPLRLQLDSSPRPQVPQQRVAIARALINNPPLLLADEPTGNLDPDHSWEVMEILKSLNLKGTTVIVASHDMVVVERMQKRILRLDHGQVLEDSPARLILPETKVARTEPKVQEEPMPTEGAQSEPAQAPLELAEEEEKTDV